MYVHTLPDDVHLHNYTVDLKTFALRILYMCCIQHAGKTCPTIYHLPTNSLMLVFNKSLILIPAGKTKENATALTHAVLIK